MQGHEHHICSSRWDSRSRLPSLFHYHLFLWPKLSDLEERRAAKFLHMVIHNSHSPYIHKYIKNSPTTFKVGPALPRHVSILKLLNVMMYFPASFCSTLWIFKEQLWYLSPVYWYLVVALLTLLSKMTRPLTWRDFTWPHTTRFTRRFSGR